MPLPEPFSWRGFRMVAIQISPENRGLRMHLQDKEDQGSLCGLLRMDIKDFDVRTGWPDCDLCIKKSEPPPPPTLMTGYTAG